MSDLPQPHDVRVLDAATDVAHDAPLVGGHVLRDLLHDVLPPVDSLLVVGALPPDLWSAALDGARHVSVLLRSYTDAEDLLREHLTVCAGSLQAFASERQDEFDAVLALDGLDRLADTGQTWADRVHDLATVLRPGGALVLAAHNPAPLDALLTGAASGSASAATFSDQTGPRTARRMRDALRAEGLPVDTVHCGFGAPDALTTLVERDLLEASGPGTLVAGVVERTLDEQCAGRDEVVAPATLVALLSGSGAISAAAPVWIGVVGGRGRSAYLRQHGSSLWLDASPSGLVTGGDVPGAGVGPALPTGVSAEHLLLGYADEGDIGSFRALAARLGSWVRESVASSATGGSVAFDDVYPTDHGFSRGLWDAVDRGSSTSSAIVLDRAWRRFAHRMVQSRGTAPWPTSLSADQLVALWRGMSGVPEDAHDVDPEPLEPPPADLTSAIDRAERSAHEADALRLQLDTMAEVLAQRDKALQLREARIRGMRRDLRALGEERDAARAETARLKTGRTYKVARRLVTVSELRDPRVVVKASLRRADGAIRAYRRMR